jgi:hypothetical protein
LFTFKSLVSEMREKSLVVHIPIIIKKNLFLVLISSIQWVEFNLDIFTLYFVVKN